MVRPLIAHALALFVAPAAALGSVLVLAEIAGRLTRWHSTAGGSAFMFSMPVGGFGWQVSLSLGRAIAAFGAARLVFWLFHTPPTVYLATALIVMFVWWDIGRFRQATRPPLRPPPLAIQVLRFKVAAGVLASLTAAILFTRA